MKYEVRVMDIRFRECRGSSVYYGPMDSSPVKREKKEWEYRADPHHGDCDALAAIADGVFEDGLKDFRVWSLKDEAGQWLWVKAEAFNPRKHRSGHMGRIAAQKEFEREIAEALSA